MFRVARMVVFAFSVNNLVCLRICRIAIQILTGTLKNYDGTAEFLRNIELSDDELTKSIIGAIGTMDSYQLPDAKGYTSMQRYLLGETDSERQKYRDEMLSTSVDDFRALADVLRAA